MYVLISPSTRAGSARAPLRLCSGLSALADPGSHLWEQAERVYLNFFSLWYSDILANCLLGKEVFGERLSVSSRSVTISFLCTHSDITQGFGYHDHHFEYQDHDYVVKHAAIASAVLFIEIITIINSYHFFVILMDAVKPRWCTLCIVTFSLREQDWIQ